MDVNEIVNGEKDLFTCQAVLHCRFPKIFCVRGEGSNSYLSKGIL